MVSGAESARRAAARKATNEKLDQRPECTAPLPAGWWGRQGVGCKEAKDRKLAEGFVRDLVLAEGRFPSKRGGRLEAGPRVGGVRRSRALLVRACREAKVMWARAGKGSEAFVQTGTWLAGWRPVVAAKRNYEQALEGIYETAPVKFLSRGACLAATAAALMQEHDTKRAREANASADMGDDDDDLMMWENDDSVSDEAGAVGASIL